MINALMQQLLLVLRSNSGFYLAQDIANQSIQQWVCIGMLKTGFIHADKTEVLRETCVCIEK